MQPQITKYSDLIALAATNSDREPCFYDTFDALAQALNFTCDWYILGNAAKGFEDRFKLSPLNTWYCSSDRVGLLAYYFDDELIGFSYQPFRKSKPEFRWIDRESVIKLKKAIYECVAELEDFKINILDESPIDSEWVRERMFMGYWD